MMKKPLLDVVFASGKRKSVLLFLQDGPKDMEAILSQLETSRQALLPQMRILEEHHLVTGSADTYELTTIGKLVAEEMVPLLGTIEVFEVDIDYWGSHNLDIIPSKLLNTIDKMKNCEIISPPLTDLYDIHKTFHIENKKPEFVYTVTALLYPNYHTIFSELIDSNTNHFFMVSKDLFERIRTEHCADFKEFIKSKFFHLFVYDRTMDFLFFTVDDYHIIMSLLRNNGEFDNKYILCNSREAAAWGKALFEHCLTDSTAVNEL